MAKFKKVAVLVFAVLMLLGVCAMSAGCSDSDKIKELQQQITELENHIKEQDGKITEFENQISEQNEKNNELEAEIASQNGRIDEVKQVNKNLSDRIKDLESQMQNYVLKISADKQVYRSEEEILIDITLENRGGADINIAYYSPLAVPDSSTGQFPAIEQSPETTKRNFKNGESIHLTDRLNGCFSVGQHSLKYRVVFYLGWDTTDSVVEISSNTIDISIII